MGGLGNGMHAWVTEAKKKQDQTNFFEIHLTLLHVFYVLFHLDTWMGLGGTRTTNCSRPTKNHPLVHPKIDLPGREKTKPLSLFMAAILQHSLLYSTFNFPIQWVSASVSVSKPLLPLFHSAIRSKPYKPSLFPVFLLFFRIGEE